MKKILIVSTLVLGGAAAFAAFKLTRAGYESPDYKVKLRDHSFEIREYPSMLLASTSMDDLNPEEGESFMRLFRYISGANESQEKISMTTPVFSTRGQDKRMSFIVPEELARKGAPEATNGDIWIERMEGGRFGAYRFSGSWDPQRAEEAVEKLEQWTREQGLQTEGGPIMANYDPPFTPAFLRRNEVLLRLTD